MGKGKTKAIIDGELCLNYEGLAEALGLTPGAVISLSRRGMPKVHLPSGYNLYPVKRCRKWCKKNVGLTQNAESPNKQTLCWKCKRAAGKNQCQWARNATPIEGWKAERTFLIGYDENKKDVPSFRVLKCPEFQPDEPRKVWPYY